MESDAKVGAQSQKINKRNQMQNDPSFSNMYII